MFKQFPETYSVIFSNNTQWLYVLFSNISIQLHILHYICIPLTLTQCNLTTWNYLSQLRVETFGIALLLRIADRLKCTVQKVIKTNSVPFTCIIIQTNSEPLSCTVLYVDGLIYLVKTIIVYSIDRRSFLWLYLLFITF